MKNSISNNVQNIEISGIRKFYNKVVKVPNAISLTLGQPDFEVPRVIKDSMIKAIEENKTTYTSNAGILELRSEISKYLKRFNIKYNEDEICITVGGSEGLTSVFRAIVNEGDKVLIPTPAYPAYESCTKMMGGKVLNYELNQGDFSINLNTLEKIIKDEKPKVMILSFPSNPTGGILNKDERDKLSKIIKDNDILVITDEIYTAVYYEDKYYSIAQCEEIRENIIYVSGFSKMFSMTGLRIGYVCATERLMNGIMKVHQYNVSCAPSIAQWGAYEGLVNCLKDVEYMKNEFKSRRDYVYSRLIDMGFEVNIPKGAFYIFPSIKNFSMESEEFCDKLLSEAKVAVVPGNAFGKGGEGYIRISYAYSMKELEEAMNKMEKFIKENK